ncbi:hypothetical protein RNJ44_01279 [Nakaseomyces bracarensis]|uniref:Uncharacterized protein n=1 Tax=Nakaseomyces bracarensis TaxID=273131 RepID=A0ABR4NRK5_9SACH
MKYFSNYNLHYISNQENYIIFINIVAGTLHYRHDDALKLTVIKNLPFSHMAFSYLRSETIAERNVSSVGLWHFFFFSRWL